MWCNPARGFLLTHKFHFCENMIAMLFKMIFTRMALILLSTPGTINETCILDLIEFWWVPLNAGNYRPKVVPRVSVGMVDGSLTKLRNQINHDSSWLIDRLSTSINLSLVSESGESKRTPGVCERKCIA